MDGCSHVQPFFSGRNTIWTQETSGYRAYRLGQPLNQLVAMNWFPQKQSDIQKENYFRNTSTLPTIVMVSSLNLKHLFWNVCKI